LMANRASNGLPARDLKPERNGVTPSVSNSFSSSCHTRTLSTRQ
jgi:hypothetical protein